MAYAPELDDGPRFVRRGHAAARLVYWPKLEGSGNVKVDADPAPTFTVFNRSGEAIVSDQAATVATVDGITRLLLPINASDEDVYLLEEAWRVDITWTFGGLEEIDTIRFSIVTVPFRPRISLNDLLEEQADIARYVEGQAEEIAGGRSAKDHASILGVRAWIDVYQWLQARLGDEGRIFPRLILDRWKLQHVIVAQTMARVFLSDGGREESLSDGLRESWEKIAKSRFAALGELAYDQDEDQVPDSKLHTTTVVRLRRVF